MLPSKLIPLTLLFCATISFAQFPEVIFDRSGQGPESGYGARVFSLGDQNNDGFMDWGIWAQGGQAGEPSEAMAEFFHGGNPPSSQPYMTVTANPDIAYEVSDVAHAGDINDDGYVDWIVFMRYLDDIFMFRSEIYLGGLNPPIEPVAIFEYPINQQSLRGMNGDFNGDGYGDLYSYNIDQGFGQVYFGGIELDTIPDMRFDQRPWGGDLQTDLVISIMTDTLIL